MNNKIKNRFLVAFVLLLFITVFLTAASNHSTLAEEQKANESNIAQVSTQELIENGGFEDGQSPWINYRSAQIQVTDEEAYSGSHSLLVAERVATVDGPQQLITGKVKAGGTYEFSAMIKYVDGPNQKVFNFNIQNGPSWENIDVMASAPITKGEWGKISGTYTIPEDADLSETFIFIETSYANPADPETDLMDFYVDEVSFVDISEQPNVLRNSDFEEGVEPWANYGPIVVEVTNEESYSGSHSLFVSGRQASTNGPKQDITGMIEAGAEYAFSVWVKYIDGPEVKNFNYNIQNGPSWQGIDVMGTSTIAKGEWGLIEGVYTVPEDADLSETFIFIETSFADPADPENDLMDFYIDDVVFGKALRTAPGEINQGVLYEGTEAVGKTPGNHNPLVSHKFGADPNVLVYDGRVYVYLTNDEYEFDEHGNIVANSYAGINTITVLSSEDLVNWTDHGAVPVAGPHGIATWAVNSWAVAVGHKEIDGQDKFFMYFSNNGSGIGVVQADSPLGPWEDPIGRPLIDGRTPGTEGVLWIFDPDVLIDDNGDGYLYYGGGVPGGNNISQEQAERPQTARVIKLSDDMIRTEGEAKLIDSPFHFESSGIHKYDGRYYYTYSTNFSGQRGPGDPGYADIAYMVSDDPMGPFTYRGVALRNGYEFFGVGGNNHQDFFEFNGQSYVAYHAQTLTNALGTAQGYRSPHINKVEYHEEGNIIDIIADMQGVEQVGTLNPYQRVEAETIAWSAGIATDVSEAPGSVLEDLNLHVTDIHNGNWIAVSQVDFGENGPTRFEANVAATVGGAIEVRLGGKDGEIIATLDVVSTGGEQAWQLIDTEVTSVTGVHDVYFVFTGEGDDNLFNFDYWRFTEAEVTEGETPIEDDDDENEQPDNDESEQPSDDESDQAGDADESFQDDENEETEQTDEDDESALEDDDETIQNEDDESNQISEEVETDQDEDEVESEDDRTLPSTATNTFNYLLIGMVSLVLAGLGILFAKKRTANE